MRPELFEDSQKWVEDENKPGIYNSVKIENSPSSMLDDSTPTTRTKATPLTTLKDFPEDDKDMNFEKMLTHVLSKKEDPEEEAICKKFCELMKRFEERIKEILELVKYEGEKLIYKVFGNHKSINHIDGKDWKNFGETLLVTPAHIFSNDCSDCKGYLYFEQGSFYVQKKIGEKKVKTDLKNLPDHFYSPITKEHLLAIVHLGIEKKLGIKVKKNFFPFFFFFLLTKKF